MPHQQHAAPQGKPSFLTLHEDIHHLICAELLETSPSSLSSLACVSQLLNAIVTPYLYRKLILRLPSNGPIRRTYKDLSLFAQSERGTKLLKHVRHLLVWDMPSDPVLLQTIVDKCGNLRHFSWNANASIPKDLLHNLQTMLPSLKISVRSHWRLETAENPSMDLDLLSSPQLDTLDYIIFDGDSSSEVESLSRALVSGAHCRSLRILFEYDRARLGPGTGFIPPHNSFPLLEEAAFYEIGWCSHSAEWASFQRACMGGSMLKKLDLGDGVCSPELLRGMADRCPNLKSLRFGLPSEATSVNEVMILISSLVGLQELDIRGIEPHMDVLWPAIQTQKANLRTLILRPTVSGYCYHHYLKADTLAEISHDFTALKRLGFDIPFYSDRNSNRVAKSFVVGNSVRHHDKSDKNKKQWQNLGIEEEYLSLLLNMNLKVLDLFLHIPGYETAFASVFTQNVMGTLPFPDLNAPNVRRIGSFIADKISSAQKNPLQVLTMHLSRTACADRCQVYDVETKMQFRRSDRDDAESMGDDKYKIIEGARWGSYAYSSTQELMAFELPKY